MDHIWHIAYNYAQNEEEQAIIRDLWVQINGLRDNRGRQALNEVRPIKTKRSRRSSLSNKPRRTQI